jgi:ring-1,2-phenylacetyl-CoA epoxidase subunit PaaC
MTFNSPTVEYLLRLGDNCLILGHRLSEWVGHGPIIEEDMALANVALDLLGQSRLWLSLAGDIEGRGRTEDRLAFLRDAGEFRNVLLVEQPNGDYAMTMARQFYFDAFHHLLLQRLSEVRDRRIADIAAKAVKEVDYHLRRSCDWVIRLGDGTAESHARMQAGIDELWYFTGELFDTDSIDHAAVECGMGVDPSVLKDDWEANVAAIVSEATLTMPKPGWSQRGGKRGVHSEHLGFLLAEMQFLQRAYPGASW